jgi:hypothetical protein
MGTMRWGEEQASAKRRMGREKGKGTVWQSGKAQGGGQVTSIWKITNKEARREASWQSRVCGSRSLILIGKARLTGLAFVHCHGRDLLSDGDGG